MDLQKRTQADVAALNAPGDYRFAPNLVLQVTSPKAKSWVFRYTLDGKARWKGLGSARDVTLAQARALADELRVNKLRKAIDPIEEENALQRKERVAATKAVPFKQRVDEFLTAQDAANAWTNAKHRKQWRSTLETYVYPVIGDVPAAAVNVAHIVDILRPIWADKSATARRVRGRIETVLDYAADPDDVNYRNPAAWTPSLRKKLPRLGKLVTKHHASLPYEEVPSFVNQLQQRSGTASLALLFTILTAARTGEVLGAAWDEIDERSKAWTVPASRMKSGYEHRVPLSSSALRLIETARSIPVGTLVFPSWPNERPLSNMAMLNVLKRLGRADVTVHGFRSTFRTWVAERTAFPREVAEAVLAHTLEDKTEAAYQRGDLFEKRRRLMQAWADHCAGAASVAHKTGDVLQLRSTSTL